LLGRAHFDNCAILETAFGAILARLAPTLGRVAALAVGFGAQQGHLAAPVGPGERVLQNGQIEQPEPLRRSTARASARSPTTAARSRSVPASEDGGKILPVLGDGRVPDGVDAAVKRMQPTSRDTPADRRARA
jgi:hypothetical protein